MPTRRALPACVRFTLAVVVGGCDALAPPAPPGSVPPVPVSSPAAAPSERYARETPEVPRFEPPKGQRTCHYQLEETTTELLGGEPQARFQSRLDYVLIVAPSGPLSGHVLRARVHAQRKDYDARLDSGRRSDRRRVAGGADTLLEPSVAEAFALVDERVTLHGPPEPRVEPEGQLRSRYLEAIPSVPRETEGWTTEVQRRFSDRAVLRWLVPGLDEAEAPSSRFERYGLAAQGRRAQRVFRSGAQDILEVKEAFVPKDSALSASVSGVVYTQLAGTRELTVARSPGDPCFARAAETLSLRISVRTSSRTEPRDLDRTRTRMWQQISTPGATP